MMFGLRMAPPFRSVSEVALCEYEVWTRQGERRVC